jgi:hypothetical protein
MYPIPTPNAKRAFENFEFYLQQQTLLNAPNPPYRIVSDKCLKHFVTYYFLDDEDEDEDDEEEDDEDEDEEDDTF